ncbi:MAG: glycoside hydrolase family 28 protein [Phycisphaerales bacterium]
MMKNPIFLTIIISLTLINLTFAIDPPQKLMVPPLAFDDSSITIIWEKPENYADVVSYNVYIEGSLAGNTKNLFYEAKDLNADTPNSFTVTALDANGSESKPSDKIIRSTLPQMQVLDITKFGALADGKTLNTKAIQKAIDSCPKGGKVLIPAGTFLSGALFLKSDMTLQIDGTLQGSDNPADYPKTTIRFPYYQSGNNYAGLINAYTDKYGEIKNVRICGSGIINGGSDEIGSITGHKNTKLGDSQAAAPGSEDSDRGDMITVKGVDGLYIAGLKMYNPAMHTIFISYSKNITVSGITVETYDIHNADGIDLATSDTAYIFNSTFDAGDDCINFNAGVGAPGVKENFPDQNIRVFNCIAKRGHGGIVFGSFTAAWIQNVLVEDCLFDGTDRGIRFKTGKNQGGGARNVICRDIKIKNILKEAIFFDSSYACSYPTGGDGQFKDIKINNVVCENTKSYGIYINGLPNTPHTNITLSNITIDGANKGGAFLKNCKNCTFENVIFKNTKINWTIDPNSTSDLVFNNCSPKP